MRKYSKKSKGAAILEPEIEAPYDMTAEDEAILQDVESAILKEKYGKPEIIEPLEPEEVGIKVFIFMPKHSKSARKLAAKQFSDGISTEKGTIKLPDGQSIKFGATCKTEMTPALKIMLRDGVFLAGKAPRKE